MTNEYVKISEGNGLFSNKFNLSKWKDAWDVAISNLKNEFAKFEKGGDWDNYHSLGWAIQKTGTTLNILYHIPLFIDGCDEEKRQKQEEKSTKEFNEIMVFKRKIVEEFLNEKISLGNTKERKKARAELNYWRGYSKKSFKALEIENKIHNQNNSFIVPTLDMYDANMSLKYKNNAKSVGKKGFMLDGRDGDLPTIMAWQNNEKVREELWNKIQNSAPKNSEIENSINVKKEMALENGFDNYLSYLDRNSPGMKLRTVAQSAKKEMSGLSSHYNKMMEEIYKRGFEKSNVKNIHEPWNMDYIVENGWKTAALSSLGNEFSLKRVLEFIIPDLLSVGGWKVESIQKIGKNKQCLYLYDISKNKDSAYFYFAPYPHASYKGSNFEAAYASILRERWGNDKNIAPIVLIAQNFTIHNGCLVNYSELSYLAHEMGHVLHFLAMNGEKFDEFNRMANNLSELPSLVLEQIASEPDTLAKWSDGDNKYYKTTNYWKRRVRKNPYDLYEYMNFLECVWMDSMPHCNYELNIDEMIKKLRMDTKMPALKENDKKVQGEFNFTSLSGYDGTYFVGRALSKKLIGKYSDKNIRKAFEKLVNNVLTNTSDDTEKRWQKTYNKSIKKMFDEGVKIMRNEYINALEKHWKNT